MKFFISLLSGSMLSQVLGIAIMLALARCYSIEAFGIYANIMAWSGVVSYVGALRLNLRFITNNEDNKPLIYRACRFLSLSTSIISLLIISGCIAFFSLSVIYLFIPIIIYCFSSYEILYDYHTSMGNHRKLNIIQLNRIIFVGIAQLSLIKFESGLILGTVIGSIIVLFIHKTNLNNDNNNEPLAQVLNLIKKNTKFIAIHTTSSIIPSIGTHLPIIFISSVFGYHASALYAIAEKITTIFVVLTNSVISRSVLYSFSNRENGVLLKYNLISIALGLIYITSSYLILPYIIYLIGEKWEGSVALLQSLSFWFAAILILSPNYNRTIFTTATKEIYLIDFFRYGLKPILYVSLVIMDVSLYHIVYLTSISMYILAIVMFIYISLRWKDVSNSFH
ncbi:polysaccharide biosynthesis protein [Photorhabdus sp. HUG-39]|nr:polysaccharide biosynthesis protein [Photorhabdus sp. HUG-39]